MRDWLVGFMYLVDNGVPGRLDEIVEVDGMLVDAEGVPGRFHESLHRSTSAVYRAFWSFAALMHQQTGSYYLLMCIHS